MGPPERQPIGSHLAAVSKVVSRAFDDALAAAGGSRVTWLVLLALVRGPGSSQREVADAVGIRGATLTHHLAGLEERGWLTRSRDPENRRVQRMELTMEGWEAFGRMREAAAAFDARLREGLDPAEVDRLHELLDALHARVQPPPAS